MRNLLAAAVLAASTLFACHGAQKAVNKVESPVVKEVPEAPKPAKVLFHGDMEFSTEERQRILLAAEMWRVQTSGLADIQVVFDQWPMLFGRERCEDCNMLVRVESTWTWVTDIEEEIDGKLLGQVAPSGGIHNPWGKPLTMLLVADRLTQGDRWMAVTVHEFGHALGLPHVSTPQSVMFPAYIRHPFACLKQHDLATFCQVNDCGTTRMHPCE